MKNKKEMGCSCEVVECIPFHRHTIEYCPLHKNANGLLEGLKRCRDNWQEQASKDELNAPQWLDDLIAKSIQGLQK